MNLNITNTLSSSKIFDCFNRLNFNNAYGT